MVKEIIDRNINLCNSVRPLLDSKAAIKEMESLIEYNQELLRYVKALENLHETVKHIV